MMTTYPEGTTVVEYATGPFSSPLGERLTAEVTVKMLVEETHLVRYSGGGVLVPTVVDVRAPADSVTRFQVPAVDQTGWRTPEGAERTGWTYEVRVNILNEFGQVRHRWTKYISPLEAQASKVQDLDLVEAQAEPVVGEIVPARFVRTVNGALPDESGNVSVVGGGGGEIDLSSYVQESELRGAPGELATREDVTTALSGVQLATTNPDVSAARSRVSVIGDSFSSPGYGSNHGHIWHTVAMSHAGGTLVANYAENGHTAADAIEGRTADWGPDLPNAQLTKAKGDGSQSVIVCLGYNDENNSVPRETFYENMRRIARELRDAGKRAIIMQPPIPIRDRAAAIPALRYYLSGLPSLCDEEGAIYLRTWDLIGDELGLPPEYGQGDGSHMNASGHDAVGLAIAPRLQRAIEGLGEYAAAIRTPRPFTVGFETMTDAVSTGTWITVPESSRDIFPSGEAILLDLGIGDDTYISLGIPYRGDNLAGSLLRFTFSYEIVSMPAAKVSHTTTNAGLFVQGGTFNPWVFTTLWGGVKLQGSRGVASVIATVPDSVTNEYVFALTMLGIQREAGDAPAQVRVGAGRIEKVVD